MMHPNRKTHPMVLTAAIAVTVFSVLGSAAITGLIPSAHSGRDELIPVADKPETPVAIAASRQERPFHSVVSGRRTSGASSPAVHDSAVTAGNPATPPVADACRICGVIESITTLTNEGEGSGLGAVAGGVVGGVAGNQIGKGKGNTLMTIIGLGGGAYAGHALEKNMKSSTAYLVKVRMEDGTYRKITQQSKPEYAVGEHVRVVSGRITSS